MEDNEDLIIKYYYFLCINYAGTRYWSKLRDDWGKYLNNLDPESEEKCLNNARKIHERYCCDK